MSKTNNVDSIASIHLHENGVIEVRDSLLGNDCYYISSDSAPKIRAKLYKLIAYAMDNAKIVNSDKSRSI